MSRFREALTDRRIQLLMVVVALSVYAIGPSYGDGGVDTDLRYGLELQGGVWMQLQVNGVTVSGSVDQAQLLEDRASDILGKEASIESSDGTYLLSVPNASQGDADQLLSLGNASLRDDSISVDVNEGALVANYLSSRFDAEAVPTTTARGTSYEVREDVSRSEAEAAFGDAGGSLAEYEVGVSDRTLETTKEVIENKINRLGLRDITVRTAGNNFILVDMAGNITLDRARDIVSKPGRFELRVEEVAGGGVNQSVHALYGDTVTSVDLPSQDQRDQWGVPFTLSESGADQLRSAVLQAGAAEEGTGKNIVMLLDGEVVYSAPIAEDLKQDFREGTVRSLRSNTGTGDEGLEDARNLEIHLKAGALPVDVEVASSGEISPKLGEDFRFMALLAGLLALVAVSIVTFLRYRQPVVTGTILAVAFSEILVLLGVSSVLQDLTLPALAGIIITVGTGIDHLIVISDEVLRKGKIPTSRTFAKRLSRANWVIYGAAFTTIIAMAPLYFMGLGHLSGFAIMTIIGVLAGVLVTRPAYARMVFIMMRGED